MTVLVFYKSLVRAAHGSGPNQRQHIPVRGVPGRATFLFHAPLPLLSRQSGAGQDHRSCVQASASRRTRTAVEAGNPSLFDMAKHAVTHKV